LWQVTLVAAKRGFLMQGFKRIFLFLLTNILVMATISIVTSVLGLNRYLTASGIDYPTLMFFCLAWGMGGALISLLLSKTMAKAMMGVKIIEPSRATGYEGQLVQRVHRLAKAAGLGRMPEVGVYMSPEVNAFATGPSRNNSLVAVSSGLLERMSDSEVEGVLGHEVAHIANGDMVTMTLIQGVVNAFAMFLARVLAYALSNFMRSDDDEGPSFMLSGLLVFVFDILFTFLGSVVVCYFSRTREFRADAGGARYAGRDRMIGALEALRRVTGLVDDSQPAMATLKIAAKEGRSLAHLFMTHPPLEQRIERLRMGR